MGRKRRENGDWFAHYHSPDNERVIKYLMLKFGSDGYMFYFRMLEVLCRCAWFKYRVANEEVDLALLAGEVGLPVGRFMEIYEAALQVTDENGRLAFVVENGFLFSPWLVEDMAWLVRKRESMRERDAAEREAAPQSVDVSSAEKKISDAEKGSNEAETPVSAPVNGKAVAVMPHSDSDSDINSDSNRDSVVNRIFSPPEKREGEAADFNLRRWRVLKKSGMANQALKLAYAMAPWDALLKADLDKDLPPADRLALVDVCADVVHSLVDGAEKLVIGALRNLSLDGWRVQQGHATPVWLLDVGGNGAQAVARVRQFSAGGNGKSAGAAVAFDGEERFCGVEGARCSACGGVMVKWALFKTGERIAAAGSEKRGCMECGVDVPAGVKHGYLNWRRIAEAKNVPAAVDALIKNVVEARRV